MKIASLLILLSALSAPFSFAQSPTPAPSPLAAHPPHPGATLSAADRAALFAAGRRAQQDPKVLAAAAKLHAARQALDAAMIAKDNSLAPILDKLKAASSPGPSHPRMTADELQKLRAARESMRGAPELDAWLKASADYHGALRAATVSSAPSVAAILDKIPARPAPSPTAASSGAIGSPAPAR